MVRESREDKVDRILTATLSELSKKGYESTTINDIADSAKISRGLLHYYFKDKEDLVAQALSFGFGTMWDASIASISSARTPEQLVDTMIDVLKKNLKEKPDFSALLFEMWVSSRRSKKINKVFADGLNEAIARLKKLFEFASAIGVLKLNPEEAEGFVRMLLAIYHGMAIQLLSSPERIDDDRIWLPIRRMLLLALR
ncbi:TetR/AcrR family transcriptional regulator [Candidatus Nitrososphaera sp. FF02]|uniref:TetR/AcrR family transcriptional regulator n=1 Tax=Candidatus Nitrososphaera sp. FF02 TaxID=3398226 RepID=UPI0039EC15DA